MNGNTVVTGSAINGSVGLTEEEVARSREKYGRNAISVAKKHSFWRRFVENMGDPVIKVLICALAVNILFMFRNSDIYETVGIGISVFLATFISTISEHGSEAAFEKLSKSTEKSTTRVLRGGTVREIPSEELVVGDLIYLGAGERIPCDAFVVSGSVSVDQSMMTGESAEIPKSALERGGGSELLPSSRDALLGGCPILSGECSAVVAAVGDGSFLGGISLEIRERTRESPLKLRLTALAKTISRIGYASAAMVAAAYLFKAVVIDSGFHPALISMKLTDVRYIVGELLNALTLGLTVVVVAVPEGLPMMIAVVLSANIKRMVKDNVLVRKPVGIEAAGSMNILFTDKTGTLTEGRLSVSGFILGSGEELSPLPKRKNKEKIYEYIALSGLCNTSSRLGESGIVGGNMTDAALMKNAAALKLDRAVRVTGRIPFDSDKKYSAVRTSGELDTVLVKGAPERLLPFVRYYRDEAGELRVFGRARLERSIFEKCSEGKRVVLLCEGSEMPSARGFGELTLIAAAIISDRPRKSAPSSVEALVSAGIQVVMVTGDSLETAKSIAAACGILTEATPLALDASELHRLGDARLAVLLPRIGVIARALPSDKSRLVRVAEEAGLVVGMTGDGINDAPALRRADIGFAMGEGTQVAKEAGDIVILDGDLASIVRAVLYGRSIFKSIRKFITLQLTMNFSAVAISMIGPFIGYESPVTVVQMLWVNIIMDTLGGLAFAGEAADESAMREKPKKRDEPILCGYMISETVWLGSVTTALSVAFLKLPRIVSSFRYDENDLYLLTAFFAFFIFASVFNCFNARTDSLNILSGIGGNKAFILIMSMVCAVQIAFVYLGGSVLRTAPLTAGELRLALMLALAVFPAELIRKCVLRLLPSGKRMGY